MSRSEAYHLDMWDVDLTEVAAGLVGKVRRVDLSVGDWSLLAIGVLILVAVLIVAQLQ